MVADPSQLFERAYCISLRRRKDRWEKFAQNVERVAWPFCPVEHFPAIDGRLCAGPEWFTYGPAWGCYRSHLAIIEQCLNEQVESVLLLEDDALIPDDFTPQVLEFAAALPDDWQMLYLGGQHLDWAGVPEQINPHVYRPRNINRTHAYALRGLGLTRVYKFLQDGKWNGIPKHIDHKLGRLHMRGDMPVYCPRKFLIAQGASTSDIAGGKWYGNRWWGGAEHLVENQLNNTPFVAVMGLHGSGSSVLAGVLWHLGCYMGGKLGGNYGKQPGGACGYEDEQLAEICCWGMPYPATDIVQRRAEIKEKLSEWVHNLRTAHNNGSGIVAAKYPQLCSLAKPLRNAVGKFAVIVPDRNVCTSIISTIARDPHLDPQLIAEHQQTLFRYREQFLRDFDPNLQLRVDYNRLVDNPSPTVTEIIRWLQTLQPALAPTAAQFDAAVRSVDASKRHGK